MDILDATWYELLISFLLTWSIGLTPPLLLRYLLLRRPFKKWGAIAIVSVFWIIESLLALAMDQVNGRTTHNHPVLILIALISYYILMRPTKSPQPDYA